MAQRARAAVQKTAKLEARAKASISSASELSSTVSELSGADSYSSGEALSRSATKCSDTTSNKPSHYGSMEDSNGDIYRLPKLSVRGGGGGERGGVAIGGGGGNVDGGGGRGGSGARRN